MDGNFHSSFFYPFLGRFSLYHKIIFLLLFFAKSLTWKKELNGKFVILVMEFSPLFIISNLCFRSYCRITLIFRNEWDLNEMIICGCSLCWEIWRRYWNTKGAFDDCNRWEISPLGHKEIFLSYSVKFWKFVSRQDHFQCLFMNNFSSDAL